MEFWPVFHPFGRDKQKLLNDFDELIAEHKQRSCRETELSRQFSELMQCVEGWPVYKVWPEYIEMLSSLPLTNVPLKLIQTPWTAFSAVFPRQEHKLKIAHYPLRQISLMLVDAGRLVSLVRRLGSDKAKNDALASKVTVGTPTHAELFLTAAWGAEASTVDEYSETVAIDKMLEINPDITMEEALAQQAGYDSEIPDYIERGQVADIWRFAIALSFLAIGQHRVIQPDVLTADMHKYIQALNAGNEEVIARLHDKATRRRGGRSWTVGRMHAIVVGKTKAAEDSEPSGRQLKNQHMRTAHYHAYWCGPGREEKVVRFVLNTVVRPDLPPREGGEGPDRVVRI